MDLVAIQAVAGAEATNFAEDLALSGLQAGELRILIRQRAQVGGDEAADGGARLRCSNPCRPVDVFGH